MIVGNRIRAGSAPQAMILRSDAHDKKLAPVTPRNCPHCDLTYNQLRTGETYRSIYALFWSGNDDPSTWVNKRRSTVLGRWHELKLSLWNHHLDLCQRQYEFELDRITENLRGDFDPNLIYPVTAQPSVEFSVPF